MKKSTKLEIIQQQKKRQNRKIFTCQAAENSNLIKNKGKMLLQLEIWKTPKMFHECCKFLYKIMICLIK